MTDPRAVPRHREPPQGTMAYGLVAFAAELMILIGIFHALMGVSAIANDDIYAGTPDYVLQINVETWGWIHLIAGIIVAIAGFALFSGKNWARVVGIVVAAVSMILNFAFIPHYPIWSLLVIALCVCIIWALSGQGRDFPARDTSRTL